MEIPLEMPLVPFWQEHALDDSALRGIALPTDLARIFLEDSRCDIEWSGYLLGVMRDEVFTVASRISLCVGKVRSVEGNENRSVSPFPETHLNRVFDVLEAQALLHALPETRAVLYHCHPRTGERVLRNLFDGDADHLLAAITEDYETGVYDYLGDPTLEDVINEYVSRHLSEEDVDTTFGNAHLLITNTPVPGHPLAHLNGYRLDGVAREPQLLRMSSYEPDDDSFVQQLSATMTSCREMVGNHFERYILPQLTEQDINFYCELVGDRMEELLKAAPPLELPFLYWWTLQGNDGITLSAH